MSRRKNRLSGIVASESKSAAYRSVSVDQLVMEVIESQRHEFFDRNIQVETDLASVETLADSQLVKAAFASLIGNATELMETGGELTVTLIDSSHQWELEVADSCPVESPPNTEAAESDLPTLIPFPQTEHLRNAHRAAMSHGGQVQTWDCPQGGTAHVLVIPKSQPNHNRV